MNAQQLAASLCSHTVRLKSVWSAAHVEPTPRGYAFRVSMRSGAAYVVTVHPAKAEYQ